MSKELEYLDDILKNEPMTLNKRTIIECIKEKIQRLEAIDNAKPSEALECLQEMWELSCDSRKPEYTLYDTIKQALIKAEENKKKVERYEKLFKAFLKEIVFEEKGHTKHKNWTRNNEYNDWYAIKLCNEFGFQIDNIHLTKEERDILCEVRNE